MSSIDLLRQMTSSSRSAMHPTKTPKKRFVAGYLIRTRQITPERLNPKVKKAATKNTVRKPG